MDNLAIRRGVSSDVERIVQLGMLLQEHVVKSNPSVWRMTEEGKKLIKQKVEADLADSNVLVLASADRLGVVFSEMLGD